MTNLRTIYLRADGEMITGWSPAMSREQYLNHLHTSPAADYIEEQWDGDTLVRFRTIRLGMPEKCEACGGSGFESEVGADTYTNESHWCKTCWNGSGVKPRVADPEWIEVAT